MSREIFDLPPYSEIWKDTKKRTPLSKERELLREIMGYIASGVVSITSNNLGDASETLREIQELLAQPEQTEQEIMAWMWDEMFCEDWTTVSSVIKPSKSKYVDNVRPLYLTPPARQPLSNKKIKDIYELHSFTIHAFARAIEKAHGITGVDDDN